LTTSSVIELIREIYQTDDYIPLHAPTFNGNEIKYTTETIKSTFVSSVGKFVEDFEEHIQQYTGVKKAVATVNGTSALHSSLVLSGVERNDLVITQALTFVATCNAINLTGAESVFVDVSKDSLGMCPISLEKYLVENTEINSNNLTCHKKTKQIIKAVLPMHTFGHPVDLDAISKICDEFKLILIEDSAESFGSFYKGVHTGNHGRFSCLSFNGNKIITTGGGGIIMCKDKKDGDLAKHLTTTAKVDHPFEFFHDRVAFNYRMPNINAALGCAQVEAMDNFLINKRKLAMVYKSFFDSTDVTFFSEPSYAKSNYWLNAIILDDRIERDNFLKDTNKKGVMTRPIWQLMTSLPMYKDCMRGDLTNSLWLEDRLVNLPSSVAPDIEKYL